MPLLNSAPAVGFDQPFEMLEACHERVHRSLGLLMRIEQHLQTNGPDLQAREAAGDVLRYFDLAAPHHHEDEERHVLPRLRSAGMTELADRLLADHQEMHANWIALRQGLLALRHHGTLPDTQQWADFVSKYQEHIALEEGIAYPAIGPQLSPDELCAIGAEMAARRQSLG